MKHASLVLGLAVIAGCAGPSGVPFGPHEWQAIAHTATTADDFINTPLGIRIMNFSVRAISFQVVVGQYGLGNGSHNIFIDNDTEYIGTVEIWCA